MNEGLKYARYVAALFLTMATFAAAAQDYPSRPIRLIVGAPPGGGTDIIARALAPHMTAQLGQQIVIENRPGGSGIIALESTARSAPDGYTLTMGITGTLVINPSLFPNLPYDSIRDFAPISLVAVGPNILVVHPSLAVRSVNELIAYARQRPGQLSYASSGVGGAPHLAGELFKYLAKVDIVHVPYKGAAPATTDVLAGHVPMMFAGMGAAISYIRSGKLIALGVAGPKRSSQLPQVPTIAEFLPGFAAETWFGIIAPRGTPSAIVERLNAAVKTAASRRDVRDQLQSGGYEVLLDTPAEFADYIAAEMKKWATVIKTSGIKAE